MVNNSFRYNTRNRIHKLASVGMLVLLLVFPIGREAAGDDVKKGCDYPAYLDDPAVKADYLSMKSEMELIARVRMQNRSEGKGISPYDTEGNLRQLDDNSRECIDCHGHKGANADEDIISGGKHPGMFAISITHAIGTDYVTASSSRQNLRKANELPPTMTLVNGRIACITCHNPLNPQRYNMAVETQGSALCFPCHMV